MVRNFDAHLRRIKIKFDHLELLPTTDDGIYALFVHFASADAFQNGQVEKTAQVLSQFKTVLPIVILVQDKSLYRYL